MVLCEQCGSIQIVSVRPKAIDRIIATVSSKRPFMCKRCGWRALRAWTDADFVRPDHYGTGAEIDPELVVLDAPSHEHRHRSRDKKQPLEPAEAAIPSQGFDFSELDFSTVEPPDGGPLEDLTSRPKQKPYDRAPRPSFNRRHRREIVATVAMSALAVFVTAMITLSGSCNGISE